MAGLSKEGLEIKRQIDVINDLKANAIPIFQDLVPVGDVVDTSDDSTLGRIIGLYSEPLSELWELAQAVYLAFDPDSATGKSLDDIVAYGSLVRKKASKTKADVYVYGDLGTTLDLWHVVRSSNNGTKFNITRPITLTPEKCHGIGVIIRDVFPNYQYTINYGSSQQSASLQISYTSSDNPSAEGILIGLKNEIDKNHRGLISYIEDGYLWIKSNIELRQLDFYSGGSVEIAKVIGITAVESDKFGSFPQSPNTIDSIATPMLGWDKVSNPFSASLGNLEETDEELRERFRNSKFTRGTNIIESLYSELFNVDGVTDIVIYENYEDYTDERGLPPHSFSVIIDGGLESEVAKAIWLNRPTGIKSNGNVEIDITDSYGYTREIRFYRPEDLNIKIRISLTRFHNFPPTGDEDIKEALIEMVNKLAIGNELVFSRLYTPINSVAGHQVDLLEVSDDGGETWKSSNVQSGIYQKIRLDFRDIEIS